MGWLKNFGPAQNILGPVKGQGISFEQAHQLIAHKLGHKNSGDLFQCENCQFKFTDIDELSDHVKKGTCQEAEVPIQDDVAYVPLRKSNKIEFCEIM